MIEIALSQAELDDILHNVRKDNDEHEHVSYPAGVSLSQSDLDALLGGDAVSTVVKPQQKPAEAPQGADAARAAKIAERKARAAEMLARVNAGSPKRVSVVYGSTLRKGDEISALRPGDTIALDRAAEAAADILVDGKLFARGILETADGSASVRLTELVQL